MSQLTLPQAFPFDDSSLPYRIDQMGVSDLDQVIKIEQLAFSTPWPVSAYRYELTQNDLSTYFVLCQRTNQARPGKLLRAWRERRPGILAYGGFWCIVDEAHISTIAVHPEYRGRGLGEMMLVGLIDAALMLQTREVTLEVRVSNSVAQNLYRKYRFEQVGRRKQYYHDNNEDALIMTLPEVESQSFRDWYAGRKQELRAALKKGLG